MRPEARILWCVIVSLAAAMTTRLSSVSRAIYHVTQIDDMATLTKHLLGVLTIAMLLRWVLTITNDGEDEAHQPRYRRVISSTRRRVLSGATVVVMLVAFPCANRRPGPSEDATFIYAQAGHWWGSIHLLCFYAYLVFGMSCAAIMCADAYRRDRARYGKPSVLGAGMGTMALATSIGCFYGLIRAAYLIVRLCHRQFIGGDILLGAISNISLLACILLMCFGCAAPTIERMNDAIACHDAIAVLRPMWRHLTREAPEVVLPGAESTGTNRLPPVPRCLRLKTPARKLKALLRPLVGREVCLMTVEFCDWRQLDFRLMRRMIEICDSIMALQAYIPEGLPEIAKQEVRRLKLPPDAATAFLLYTAIRRKRAGHPMTTASRKQIVQHDDDYRRAAARLMPIWFLMRNRSVINSVRRAVIERESQRDNGQAAA